MSAHDDEHESIAQAWLIEHNHHACHESAGIDEPFPRPVDVQALAKLLRARDLTGAERILGHPDPQMVERAAEAIHRHEGGMGDDADWKATYGDTPRKLWKTDAPWDSNPTELTEWERDDYRAQALAALLAALPLRADEEPTGDAPVVTRDADVLSGLEEHTLRRRTDLPAEARRALATLTHARLVWQRMLGKAERRIDELEAAQDATPDSASGLALQERAEVLLMSASVMGELSRDAIVDDRASGVAKLIESLRPAATLHDGPDGPFPTDCPCFWCVTHRALRASGGRRS